MKALVFADRGGRSLSPLTEDCCTAMLPVAGKPLLQHTLESLVGAGIREATLVVSSGADAIEQAFGEGTRLGMHIDYALSRGGERPEAVARRIANRLGGDCVVVRGDILRSDMISLLLAAAKERPGVTLFATVADAPAGLSIVRRGSQDTWPALAGDPEDAGEWRSDGEGFEVEDGRLDLVTTLGAYHRANLDAAAGRYPGLLVPGLARADGAVVGRQSRVPGSALRGQRIFVGARCDVSPTAELEDDVVLGDGVIVDRSATLRSTVVLPGSYVGPLICLENALVAGPWLVRVDTDTVVRIPDPFLLADLKQTVLTSAIGNVCHRALGALLLLASLPLWPLALLDGLLAGPRSAWRRVRRVGNRMESDAQGIPCRRSFTDLELGSRRPLLRHLPRLLAVASGDLRLVGVAPLTQEQEAQGAEGWERVRDSAPRGLVGPSQLEVAADAPAEECLLADAVYARTRSVTRDLRWLGAGLLALLGRHAWKRAPAQPIHGGSGTNPEAAPQREESEA